MLILAEGVKELFLIMKSDFRIRSNLHLDSLIRLGSSEGIAETAVGLGLTYKLIGGK